LWNLKLSKPLFPSTVQALLVFGVKSDEAIFPELELKVVECQLRIRGRRKWEE
jgi:hypothetical protein